MSKRFVAAALFVLAGGLLGFEAAEGASPQVVPPAYAATEGSSANVIPLGGSVGRYMVMYGADQLTGIPRGSVITAIEMRQSNGASAGWPAASDTTTSYSIFLATSGLTPATMSTTFDTNVQGRVQVRSGSQSLETGAYPGTGSAGATPEPWGRKIVFSREYVYNGGPLVIEIQSSGNSDGGGSADTQAVGASFAGMGSIAAANSATGFSTGAIVVRLTFEPQDLAKGVTKVIVGENQVDDESTTSSFTLSVNAPRTQMAVVNANQFDTIGTGSDIVGMTWRTTGGWTTTSPAAGGANYTKFDVQMSRSQNAPGALSTAIALNVGSNAKTVRSGPLFIPAGSFPTSVGESTGAFGGDVAFSNTYQYMGGPLLSVIRHDGEPGTDFALSSIGTTTADYNVIVQSYRNNGSSVALTAPDPSSTEITRYSVDAGTISPKGVASPNTDGGLLTFEGAVYQTILAASELADIPVGSVIDSLWLRRSDIFANPGPSEDWTAADFEVYVSSATNNPESISLTFAANEGADRVMVHDGPHQLAKGSLPGGSTGEFGKFVQFEKHFVYKGGPLCIRVRQIGVSDGLNFVECVENTATRNRSVYSLTDSASGGFFGGSCTGTAMKLGYIPSVITPNNLARAEGTGGLSMPTTASYTAQVIVAADQLRAIDVGSAITGVSLRHSASGSTTSFPAATTTLGRFDVTIAPAASGPLGASNTFASNNGPGVVNVRSGAVTVPVNAFPYSGSSVTRGENAWYVPFDRAYVYTGGDLCLTIRSDGPLGGGGETFDADGTSANARGVTKTFYGNSNAAVASSTYGPLAVRWAFTARAFCPWDLNNDGVVSDDDFPIFLIAYNTLDCTDGAMAMGCPADFNYDRVVDDADFEVFIGAYNELLCP
jgi:hypothetical protein